MRCICKRFTSSFEIKKSEFICVMIPFEDDKQVSTCIQELKKEYPKATHYCYAYRIKDKEKSNDDGEPSGTAGRPILEFLKKNDLGNILCVVIRYFGGIKLGASGLLRAYVDACKETYALCEIYKTETLKKYNLSIDYKYYEFINKYLVQNKALIISSSFEEKIDITFALKELDEGIINNLTNGNIQYNYLENIEILVKE